MSHGREAWTDSTAKIAISDHASKAQDGNIRLHRRPSAIAREHAAPGHVRSSRDRQKADARSTHLAGYRLAFASLIRFCGRARSQLIDRYAQPLCDRS